MKKIIYEIDQTLSENEVSESQQVAKTIEKSFSKFKGIDWELGCLEDNLIGIMKWAGVIKRQ